MAQQLEQSNPELVAQLRQQFGRGPPGQQPPSDSGNKFIHHC